MKPKLDIEKIREAVRDRMKGFHNRDSREIWNKHTLASGIPQWGPIEPSEDNEDKNAHSD